MDSQQDGPLDRVTAAEYASWFRALADATRVQIVSLLARRGGPMTVGEITAALDVGQSTVSAHLKVLAGVRFVLAERRGTSAWYRINDRCVACFPTAADIVMGRQAHAEPDERAADEPGDAIPDGVLIRPMEESDGGQVLAIYQAGLDTGQASFETQAPRWGAFNAAKLPAHRHVASDAATGQVLGWVAVSATSSRHVYAGVVEHSVYVHPAHHGRGLGSALLAALIASTEAAGIWTIQSSIFAENDASFRLHQRAGFRVVGTRERVACHHGRWRDTVILERRSMVTGHD
jgi:L-amino acid N-acyltransferase YncA/DNA-binding transcriptional ArsR family regulator